jgi:hypothetical protein
MTDLTAQLNALIALSEKATPEKWQETLEANAEAVKEQAELLRGPDHVLMAQLARQIHDIAAYIAAISPEVVRALAEIAMAGIVLRNVCDMSRFPPDEEKEWDAALTRLAAAMEAR